MSNSKNSGGFFSFLLKDKIIASKILIAGEFLQLQLLFTYV